MSFEQNKSLAGKKILITRSNDQSLTFITKLTKLEAKPISCPIVRYELIEKEVYNKSIINNLSKFDWIFFTSQNAVKFFFEILDKNYYDSRALANIQIAVVGYKTKLELAKYNIKADFIPKRFSFEDLTNELNEKTNLKDKLILYPTQIETCHGMSQQNIRTWHIYKANFIEKLDEEIINQIKEGIDIITFFSSNTAEHFARLAEKHNINVEACRGMPLIAVIGDETANTVKKLFGRIDIIAEPFTEEGLIKSIEKHFAQEKLINV